MNGPERKRSVEGESGGNNKKLEYSIHDRMHHQPSNLAKLSTAVRYEIFRCECGVHYYDGHYVGGNRRGRKGQ